MRVPNPTHSGGATVTRPRRSPWGGSGGTAQSAAAPQSAPRPVSPSPERQPEARAAARKVEPPSPHSLLLSPSPSLGSLPWRWWPTPASRGRIRLPGGRIRTLRRQICPPRASACRGAAVGPRASARLGRRRRRRPRPRDTAAATPSVAGPHQGAAAAAPAASCAAVVGQPEQRCGGSAVVVCAESGLLGRFPASPWWRHWLRSCDGLPATPWW